MIANEILRYSSPDATIGRNWMYNYYNMHPDIGTLTGDPHEAARRRRLVDARMTNSGRTSSTRQDKFCITGYLYMDRQLINAA
jgi:hypothetical protein